MMYYRLSAFNKETTEDWKTVTGEEEFHSPKIFQVNLLNENRLDSLPGAIAEIVEDLANGIMQRHNATPDDVDLMAEMRKTICHEAEIERDKRYFVIGVYLTWNGKNNIYRTEYNEKRIYPDNDLALYEVCRKYFRDVLEDEIFR